MVGRPRLLATVRRRFDVGVVAVVAGAGFGKTTLLRQAVADNLAAPRGIDVWLPCNPADTVASRLAARLREAVGAGAAPVEDDGLGLLLAALAERATVPTCVLVDDVHELGDVSTGGAALLRNLVARAPANVHFVLASRRPLPGLARRRARYDVVEVGEDDLRLTGDEIERSRAALGTAAFTGAEQDFGGWPALVALAMTLGPSAAREFAREEVLEGLDADRRRALAALAAVGGGDRAACRAAVAELVGPEIDVDDVLAGLPLVWADDHTIGIHALWARVLADELTDAERWRVMHGAAARCLKEGDAARAFDLGVAVGDTEVVRAAIHQQFARGYAAAPTDLLARWLDQLPVALLDEPEGRLLAGKVTHARDAFAAEAHDHLERAMQGFRDRGDVVGELASASELAFVARARSDLPRLMPLASRGFELEAAGHEVAQGMCQLTRGMLADLNGDDGEAHRLFSTIEEGAISPGWHVVADFMAMMGAFHQGLPELALASAHRCVERARSRSAYALLTLPGLHWQLGRPSLVPAELPDLPAPGASTATERLWSGVSVAVLEAGRGRLEAARAASAAARGALWPEALPYLRGMVAAASASTLVAAGDDAGAERELAAFLAEVAPPTAAAGRALRWAFSVAYVLAPAMRERWDTEPLGPLFVRRRTVARTILAFGAGWQPDDDHDAPWPDAEEVAAAAPLAWTAPLAVALIVHGRENDGRALANVLAAIAGPAARDALAAAERSGDPVRADGARRLRRSLPTTGRPPIELDLLGPTRLALDGVGVDHPNWRRRRVRELLAFVTHHGRVPRDRVLGALWPDFTEEQARRNLRVTLTYLQALLESGRPRGEPPFYLRVDGDALVLLGEPHISVDLWCFEADIVEADRARAAGDADAAAGGYARARSRWRGEYLEDFMDAEWAAPLSAQVHAAAVLAGTRGGNAALAAGRGDDALRAAEWVLAIESWSEEAFRVAVAAHLAAGDHAEAAKALARCDAMLADLGVPAGPETEMLRRTLMLSGRD